MTNRNAIYWPSVGLVHIVTVLFAMIFKLLPDARLSRRDVRLGAALTAGLFLVGKYALGLGQRRTGLRLRSGRFADHDADMDLLCRANCPLRRGVYSSLRAGTWQGIRPARHAVRVDRGDK